MDRGDQPHLAAINDLRVVCTGGQPLAGRYAEAIVGRPIVQGQVSPLPRYGEIFFDDTAATTSSGGYYPIALGTPITMVDGNVVLSAPEMEPGDNEAFKVRERPALTP